jgi:hypothetical protein
MIVWLDESPFLMKLTRDWRRQRKVPESFSDVVLQTVKTSSGDLNRFFGAWTDDEYAKVGGKVLEDRKHSGRRDAVR